MHRHQQYILFALIALIVYLVSLILQYTYRDFEINAYRDTITQDNVRTKELVSERESERAYVQTNAYVDRIMKASQDRKDPGEDIVILVDNRDVANNQPLDVMKTISETHQTTNHPYTQGRTNEEKWLYYVFGVQVVVK